MVIAQSCNFNKMRSAVEIWVRLFWEDHDSRVSAHVALPYLSIKGFVLRNPISTGHILHIQSYYIVQTEINQPKWSCSFQSLCPDALLRVGDAAPQTHHRGSLVQNILLMSLFWWFFYILFLNNSSKLCTKRFGQRQPVLCWISHIDSSQWHDFKTSERSWTGDHDTRVVMTDVLHSTSCILPLRSTWQWGHPRKKAKQNPKANLSELKKIKTREKNSDTARGLGQTHVKVQQRSK